MYLEEFVAKHEFLYHLTDQSNLKSILSSGRLLAATEIVRITGSDKSILTMRRPESVRIQKRNKEFIIRDQRPINKALSKCLEPGLSEADFFMILNSRVFFWPNEKRLISHFNRYASEHPAILRVSSESLFEKNQTPKFSRLNSGATRANSYLGGVAPERGHKTFLVASEFDHRPSEVAEVTFETVCVLPDEVKIGYQPRGPWKIFR
jgi:hypothetical protein